MRGLSTHLRAVDPPTRVVHALAVSATLSCILAGAFWTNSLPLAAEEVMQRVALGYLPIVAAAHNIFYLGRLGPRRRMAAAYMPAWPATSFFGSSRQVKVFVITSILVAEFHVAMTGMVLIPGPRGELSLWRQGFAGCMVALVFIAAIAASIAVIILAARVTKAEKRVTCDAEGHVWQCTRCQKKHGSDASTHEHANQLSPNVRPCKN
jgi:hypothetical protein